MCKADGFVSVVFCFISHVSIHRRLKTNLPRVLVMEGLNKCPFCGAGEFEISENTLPSMKGNLTISVVLRHWCNKGDGVLNSYFEIRAKDFFKARDAWNKRS